VNVYDQSGTVTAWIRTDGHCPNDQCRAAIKDGRPVHIIPAHTDPRANRWSLALATYHYATADQAAAALETAWATAEEASTPAQRGDAYARGVNVKLDKAARW
jgi:hypothetical protein